MMGRDIDMCALKLDAAKRGGHEWPPLLVCAGAGLQMDCFRSGVELPSSASKERSTGLSNPILASREPQSAVALDCCPTRAGNICKVKYRNWVYNRNNTTQRAEEGWYYEESESSADDCQRAVGCQPPAFRLRQHTSAAYGGPDKGTDGRGNGY